MTTESELGTGPFLMVTLAGDRAPNWPSPSRDDVRTLTLDMSHKHHRGFWAMQLDEATRGTREPRVVVARGLACLAVVRWAQLSPKSYIENIAGAVLFSPLSFTPAQATLAQALQPSPTLPLPFRSTVVEHRASPLIEHLLALVDSWGSRFVDVGDFAATGGPVPPTIDSPDGPIDHIWA
jgi:predicted alpha/beta hydrolase family esterase